MIRQFRFSIRVLLAIVLLTASFFAGMAVDKRETDDLRNALKVEQESSSKTTSIMRKLGEELMEAKHRIKELDGREGVVAVSSDDLESGKVVVIGRLGSPLKTLLTIRGTWQRNRMSKDYGPSFHVTHVNGKALDKPVIFYQVLVHVSYPRPWDEHDESKNRPEPCAGQSWEIRAYETGGFVDSPGEYKEELGKLLPYLEEATVWRNFKVELHGVMQRESGGAPPRH